LFLVCRNRSHNKNITFGPNGPTHIISNTATNGNPSKKDSLQVYDPDAFGPGVECWDAQLAILNSLQVFLRDLPVDQFLVKRPAPDDAKLIPWHHQTLLESAPHFLVRPKDVCISLGIWDDRDKKIEDDKRLQYRSQKAAVCAEAVRVFGVGVDRAFFGTSKKYHKPENKPVSDKKAIKAKKPLVKKNKTLKSKKVDEQEQEVVEKKPKKRGVPSALQDTLASSSEEEDDDSDDSDDSDDLDLTDAD
jgi:hypothetical protein